MQLTTPLVNTAWTRFRHARESVHAAVDCLRALEPGSLLVIDGVEQLRSRDLRSLLRKSQRRDVFLARDKSRKGRWAKYPSSNHGWTLC